MRSTLCKFFLVPAIAAAAAVLAPSAKAERVVVPFNFTAYGHNFAAGAYNVQKDLNGNFVHLRSADTESRDISAVLRPGNPSPAETRVVLRFVSTGENYTLETIQYGSKITARMPQPKHGREVPPQVRVVVGG